ncbi:MAG TPA: DNA polymerase III subunit beta [Deltaproteobacteria bacterium]|nr:DNA polymerase III subunit beta [Deltaproteobacteria bacterium]
MEFKITRENFLEGLGKTQGVVEKKNTMPVLSNILLEADKKGLTISATDMEVALVFTSAAQVIQPGKITVSCRHIYDIVREINQPEVVVSLKQGNRLEVKAGTSVFNIPGLEANEFPAIPTVEKTSVEVSCDVFLNMIEKTSFCMSTDETRHNLAGIHLEKEKGGAIRMVATDGHRLSLVDQDFGSEGLDDVNVIIPRKGIGELKKMVSQEGCFELAVDKRHLCARKGNETLYARLIDGEFPDYGRVIPNKTGSLVSIPRQDFIGALRRVSLLSNERSRGVVINLSPGHLEVFINNPDLGEAREEFKIDYKGEKLGIGFNARYFLDVLNAMKDDMVILGVQNELAPCVIKSEKDHGFLSVIMPMRI